MSPVSGSDRVLRQRRQAARSDALDQRVRAHERQLLMDDLYDSVVHQLSVAAVQLMSPPGLRSTMELQAILGTVSDATEVALGELRLLVQLRREDPTSGRALAVVGQRVPSVAVSDWARLLRGAGYPVSVSISPEIDCLAPSARTTITRAIDVACGNIMEHATPGARCSVALQLRAGEIVCKISNQLACIEPPGVSPDGALSALRQRVELLGGRFRAERCLGPDGVQWVLVLTMPGPHSSHP